PTPPGVAPAGHSRPGTATGGAARAGAGTGVAGSGAAGRARRRGSPPLPTPRKAAPAGADPPAGGEAGGFGGGLSCRRAPRGRARRGGRGRRGAEGRRGAGRPVRGRARRGTVGAWGRAVACPSIPPLSYAWMRSPRTTSRGTRPPPSTRTSTGRGPHAEVPIT